MPVLPSLGPFVVFDEMVFDEMVFEGMVFEGMVFEGMRRQRVDEKCSGAGGRTAGRRPCELTRRRDYWGASMSWVRTSFQLTNSWMPMLPSSRP